MMYEMIIDAYRGVKPDAQTKERMLRKILSEAEQSRENSKLSRYRAVLLAALMAVLLLMGCTAVVFDLAGLKMGEYIRVSSAQEDTTPVSVISLHGLADSPNNLAYSEWHAFTESYDPDNSIRDSLGEDFTLGEPYQDYEYYGCYTMEMVEKLDEICQKYSLSILKSITHVDSGFDELFEGLGIDSFFSSEPDVDNDFDWAYYYQDGSFEVCADLMIMQKGTAWPNRVWYFMDRCMKDSISNHSNTTHIAGDIENYEQWTYTTDDGVTLLMVLGFQDALIVADLEDSYVTIHITNATYGAVEYEGELIAGDSMDRTALEAVADCFDFAALS